MDPFHCLFTSSVVDKLAKVQRAKPSKWDSAGLPVRERHVTMACSGPEPSRGRWARRKSWAAYLRAAERCGLLGSSDVVGRLVGADDDGFRSALAECLVAWFFDVRRRVKVRPNAEAKTAKNFDLVLEGNEITVSAEVKAPYVPRLNQSFSGNDSATLRASIEKAGTQFKKDRPNLVVLVPLLRTQLQMNRSQLLKATIGESALSVFVSLDGSPPPKPQPTFLQQGKLAKIWPDGNGAFRTDLTRISAVVTIEESYVERSSGLRIGHSVIVIHNPFATHPIPREFFGRVPQWLARNGRMGWSDRYRGM